MLSIKNEMGVYIITISIILWIFSFIIAIILGIYTLIRISKKSVNKDISSLQTKNIFTWGIFYILIASALLLFVIWYYFITELFVSLILDYLLVSFFHLAILVKSLNTEYIINKHKIYRGYYMTSIFIFLTVFTLIISPPIVRANLFYFVLYHLILIVGMSFFIIYFVVIALKADKKHRNIALRFMMFPLMVIIGIFLLPYNVENYYQPSPIYGLLYVMPQILLIIGLILVYGTYHRSLK